MRYQTVCKLNGLSDSYKSWSIGHTIFELLSKSKVVSYFLWGVYVYYMIITGSTLDSCKTSSLFSCCSLSCIVSKFVSAPFLLSGGSTNSHTRFTVSLHWPTIICFSTFFLRLFRKSVYILFSGYCISHLNFCCPLIDREVWDYIVNKVLRIQKIYIVYRITWYLLTEQ